LIEDNQIGEKTIITDVTQLIQEIIETSRETIMKEKMILNIRIKEHPEKDHQRKIIIMIGI